MQEWEDARGGAEFLAFMIMGLLVGLLCAVAALVVGAGLLAGFLAFSLGGSCGFMLTAILHGMRNIGPHGEASGDATHHSGSK